MLSECGILPPRCRPTNTRRKRASCPRWPKNHPAPGAVGSGPRRLSCSSPPRPATGTGRTGPGNRPRRPAGGPRGRFDTAGRALPVVAAPARKGSIDVYLNALGTVTPRNIVTVQAARRRPVDARRLRGGTGRQGGRRCWRRSIRARSRCSSRRRRGRWRRTRRCSRTRSSTSSATGRCSRRIRSRSSRSTRRRRWSGNTRAPIAGGPGRDRQREAAAHLHARDRADRRPRRPAPGRSGQHRARVGHERARRHHAAAADHRHVPDSGGQRAARR